MQKKSKLPVKIGDTVKIIAGLHKNQVGEIKQVNKMTGKVIVKGINLKFKHTKPTNENEMGEIKQIEAPIHHSNVKLTS
jgi:large subunit ribosomal protein L24